MADEVTEYLKCEWVRLSNNLTVNKHISEGYFIDLIAAYNETHRFYHRPEHLQHLMVLLHESGAIDDAVYWASFYHDYVYHPGKSTNEIKSADIAAEQLLALGVSEDITKRVFNLILATQHHKLIEDDNEAALFLDADMAILGEASEVYREYVNRIKREFINIPQFLYKRGRKSFLKKLLSEKQVFYTEWFYKRFEKSARENLLWEVDQL